jgi:serine/threonine protein kinase/tricorn protease-like protein
MIGKIISHYKITEKLGEGGMGVVYKAEDTKLDRTVALKFLPHQLTTSDTERARFLQEAKAASALNHPNVCVIYDIKEHDGEQFIVMEYVDGRTLRDIVGAEDLQPLPLNEVIHYALQIADALKEAHANGIVHRDIKSENIMVNSKNQTKVMDFGLAKLKGSLKLTQTASTVGTLAYMAPEQVQGIEVDSRADIFSFGVVLYEMLAGRLPFQGDYDAAVVYAIANEEPEPIHKFRSELSSEFLHVLNRALEKHTEDRYQSMGDMLIDLRRVEKEAAKKPGVVTSPQSAGKYDVEQQSSAKATPRWIWPTLAAVSLMALLIVFFMFFRRKSDAKVIGLTNPRKITQAIGKEGWPTWSPDGSRIAYASDQSGRWDIWMRQLASGEPINRTKDMANGGWRPSWSPDGIQIAFLTVQGGVAQVFVMPAIGGTATRVASTGFWSNQAWSPDGTRLAYVVRDSSAQSHAEIYTLATHETKSVPLPGTGFERTNLSWSPLGDTFAYTDAVQLSGFLRTVRLAEGTSFQITKEDGSVRSAQWSADARLLYFSSNHGGTRDLWRVKLDDRGDVDGKPEQISNGLGIENFAFSPDRTKIAYGRGETISNLWRVAIPKPNAPAAQWTEAKQLTFEASRINYPEFSPDGKRIYFTSTRSGNPDIWSMRAEGGQIRQVTTAPERDQDARFSPDGSTIAFGSTRSGNFEIWTMPATGGPARQITHDQSPKWYPRWSPDGQTLAYVAQDSVGKLNVWVIPAQGGEARQVATAQGNLMNVLWWPDGQSLVSLSRKPTGLMRFATTGGPPKLLSEPDLETFASDGLRWSADKKYIYSNVFNDMSLTTKNIWSLTVADGSLRQLTDFKDRQGRLGRRFATDGTYFYFIWLEDLGDIWVMDVEKEE